MFTVLICDSEPRKYDVDAELNDTNHATKPIFKSLKKETATPGYTLIENSPVKVQLP